ncbi:alpha/beta hydrolase [Adhaeribacter rhizoryzae]|uniref:Alpha/beta hydrolase n=1 Tax=Adhaeribacter rhizoryzae TaxID=2607907 RepID=A0A5M6CUQ3_9BACT|nr:alpha/beta hydrolase [Adhaeribacter rhizoryzae]KAA5538686.1 alpha/beta hydrolase [Adhaeribacter rhizoryzae]
MNIYKNTGSKYRGNVLIWAYWIVMCLWLSACVKSPLRYATAQIIDTDQDGIHDFLDECPETPGNVKVDRHGCPVDSDKDGLPDYQDPCPTQPGIPCADADGDGVPDNIDKCPDAAGPLSNDGCPITLPKNLTDSEMKAALSALEKAEDDKRRVTVFFCTNRKIVKKDSGLEIGNTNAALSYGTCRVSIPRDHQMGNVETPISLLGYTIEKPNPAKHIVVVSTRLTTREELFSLINEKTDESTRKDAFIFIHGFNNTFEEAMLRTAQFTYDLGFEGAPIMFSWPSQGSPLPNQYRVDERLNRLSIAPFKNFLRHFLQKSKANNIYLIAHSMGNRIMVAALKEMMTEEPYLFRNRNIQEIVLTAPDISVNDFKRDIVPVVKGSKSNKTNLTLYASSDDIPLKISMGLNLSPRAGQAGPGILILPGIETIDATGVSSDFLKHSYFSSEGAVVSDLHYLFREKWRANQRKWLMPAGKKYWKFKVPNEN